MKRKHLNWMAVFVWAAIILYLSTTPIQTKVEVSGIDLLGHAVFYGVLTFLILNAFKIEKGRYLKYAVSTIIIATLYGTANEILQTFIEGRTATFLDGIANFTGSFLGLICYWTYFIRSRT